MKMTTRSAVVTGVALLVGIILLFGWRAGWLARETAAPEPVAPPEFEAPKPVVLPVEFESVFKEASAVGDRTRVIVADDFEGGVVRSDTHDPFGRKTGFRFDAPAPGLRARMPVIDPEGMAELFPSAGVASSGMTSIIIRNSPSVVRDFTPVLCWWLYGKEIVRSGTFEMVFDYLIPKEAGNDLDVMVRDTTDTRTTKPRPYQDHFVLHFKPGSITLGDQSLAVATGEWVHVEVAMPVGVSTGSVQLRVADSVLGRQTAEMPLRDAVNGINWIGLSLPGKSDAMVLLDNLVIKVVDETPVAEGTEEAVEPEPATEGEAWQAAPPELLDVFPGSVAEVPEEDRGETVLSSTYTPSGSVWGEGLDERWVFHLEMKHDQGEPNSFALRVGKGGQVYSLRGAFGESVPPQGKGNPWNDEVWQFVSVCHKYTGDSPLLDAGPVPEEVAERFESLPYAKSFFIHNSGAYIPADSALRYFYCPLLAAGVADEGRTYRTVNWGLVPQMGSIHRSPILYYVQTRDVGDGIIELTWVVHNFSVREDIVFDHLNAPWGGTRLTSLPVHYVSDPDGELLSRQTMLDMGMGTGVDVRKTGGWNLSCVSDVPDSPSLALVFGRDRHLEEEQGKAEQGLPYTQFSGSIFKDMLAHYPDLYDWFWHDWDTRPENSFRNYDVAVVIPKFYLRPGETVWYRSFLVVNSRDRAIELAKSLVDKVDYGLLTFDPADTPMVLVFIGHVEDAEPALAAVMDRDEEVSEALPVAGDVTPEEGHEAVAGGVADDPDAPGSPDSRSTVTNRDEAVGETLPGDGLSAQEEGNETAAGDLEVVKVLRPAVMGRDEVDRGAVPAFELYAKPVPGTMPLFLIENKETGQDVITTDPYIFVPREELDLDVLPEHPNYDYYSRAAGYSLDKNYSNWKRLLGYGCVEKPEEGSFVKLSDVLDPAMFPEENTYHRDLWVRKSQE